MKKNDVVMCRVGLVVFIGLMLSLGWILHGAVNPQPKWKQVYSYSYRVQLVMYKDFVNKVITEYEADTFNEAVNYLNRYATIEDVCFVDGGIVKIKRKYWVMAHSKGEEVANVLRD